jgi:hypothetical protein
MAAPRTVTSHASSRHIAVATPNRPANRLEDPRDQHNHEDQDDETDKPSSDDDCVQKQRIHGDPPLCDVRLLIRKANYSA